jgi:hypothetical protein
MKLYDHNLSTLKSALARFVNYSAAPKKKKASTVFLDNNYNIRLMKIKRM